MNLLSGAFNYIAGDEVGEASPVTRLIERIKSSALPQDRRAAVSELSRIAKTSPSRQREIGTQGLKILYAIIEQDREYEDTVQAALELLIDICGQLDITDESTGEMASPEILAESVAAAEENVNIFLALPNAIPLLLDLLQYDDYHVRFDVVELLTAMTANAKDNVQAVILSTPEGVARLCEALDDDKDIIRANALILLTALSDSSAEICKIMIFAGIVGRIFSLLDGTENSTDEEYMDAGTLERAVTINDCLCLLRNLLDATTSTQSFLREGDKVRQLGKQLAAASHFVRGPRTQDPAAARITKQWISICSTCLHCIELAAGGDNADAQAIRVASVHTGILTTALSLAFAQENGGLGPPSIRVRSLKAIGNLLHGCEESKAVFASYGTSLSDKRTSPQIESLRAFCHDSNAAVRASSLLVFQESFIADPILNTPSSALLNGIVNASGIEKALSTKGSQTGGDDVFGSIRATLTGWPHSADGGAVFYCALLLCWVLNGIDGAKQALVASNLNPSENSLLVECVRSLGRAERGNAPSAVKIGLLRILCTWLYENPPAVSSFLSKAMHLPLLMEMITKEPIRGDQAQIHVQGLAALLLAISFNVAEGRKNVEDLANGEDKTAVDFSQSARKILDIIKNRLGVNSFTSMIEELRTSKSYKKVKMREASGHAFVSLIVDELVFNNKWDSHASAADDLGHSLWYDSNFCQVIDITFGKIGDRALDFMVSPANAPRKGLRQNGVAGEANGYRDSWPNGDSRAPEILADSTRDELITSYKDFIRTQDQSLSEARSQVKELTDALKEAHAELDHSCVNGRAGGSSETETLQTAVQESQDRAKALETLLAERTSDFEALSQAYSDLEAERNINGEAGRESGGLHLSTVVDQLRTQKTSLVERLDAEVSKANGLERVNQDLDAVIRASKDELQAITRERDTFKSLLESDEAGGANDIKTAELQRRVEVAEASLQQHRLAAENSATMIDDLRSSLRYSESAKEEAVRAATLAEASSKAAREEIERIQASRVREIQLAKESASAAAVAGQENLSALQRKIKALEASQTAVITDEEASVLRERSNSLEQERISLMTESKNLKTELADSRNSVQEWQKRAEAASKNYEIEKDESVRLSNVARALQQEVDALKARVTIEDGSSSNAERRVAELQNLIAEEREYHKSTQEELNRLRDEVASRAEQTIRLSGRIYEAEEARAEADAQKDEFLRMRESLTAVQKDCADARSKCEQLERLVDSLQEAKLSLDEAEESKRTLSLQVIELKSELAEMQLRASPDPKATHVPQSNSKELDEVKTRLDELSTAHNRLQNERDMSSNRVTELESKLSHHETALEEREQERSRLLDEKEEYKRALDLCKEEVAEQRQHISELETSIQDYKTAIDSLRSSSELRTGNGESGPLDALADNDLQRRATNAEENLVALQKASVSVIKKLREELAGVRLEATSATADSVAKLAILEASHHASEEAILKESATTKDDLTRRLQSVESLLAGARDEAEHLKQRVRELEFSLKESESRVQSSNTKVSSCEQEIALLKKSIEEKATESSSIAIEMQELKSRHTTKSSEYDLELEKRNAVAQEKRKLENELVSRDAKISKLENLLEKFTNETECVYKLVEDMEEKVKFLETQAQSHNTEQIPKIGRDSDGVLSNRVQQLSNELSLCKEKLYSAEHSKNNALLSVTQLKEEVAKLQASLSASESRAEVFKSSREMECSKLQSEIDFLKDARSALQQSANQNAKELQDKIKDAVEQVALLNTRHANVQKELQLAQEKSSAVTKALENEIVSLKTCKDHSDGTILELKKEKTAKENLLSKTQNDVRTLRIEIETARKNSLGLREELNHARDLLRKTQDDLKAQEISKKKLSGEMDEQKEEIERLKPILEAAEANATALVSLRESLEKEKLDLQKLIEALRKKLVNAEEDLSNSKCELKETNKAMKQLRDEMNKVQVEFDRSKRARGVLEEENESLRGDLDKVEGSKVDVEENLNSALKDNETLRKWVADLEKKAAELQSVAKQFEEVEFALDEQMKAGREAWEKIEALEKTKEEADVKLIHYEEQLKNADLEKQELSNSSDALQSRLAELGKTLAESRKAHVEKVREYEENVGKSGARIQELEGAIMKAERQIAEGASTGDQLAALSGEVKQKTKEIEKVKTQLQESEEKCKDLESKIRGLEKDLEGERNSSGKQAFTDLEAEHNELLVYLAELELEHNTKGPSSQLQSATSGEAF